MHIKENDIVRFATELNSLLWTKHNILFLDEVSFDNRGMVRSRGYGELGYRLPVKAEFKRLPHVSLLVMIYVFGVVEVAMTEGTFTRHKFFEACCRLADSQKCSRTQARTQFGSWMAPKSTPILKSLVSSAAAVSFPCSCPRTVLFSTRSRSFLVGSRRACGNVSRKQVSQCQEPCWICHGHHEVVQLYRS